MSADQDKCSSTILLLLACLSLAAIAWSRQDRKRPPATTHPTIGLARSGLGIPTRLSVVDGWWMRGRGTSGRSHNCVPFSSAALAHLGDQTYVKWLMLSDARVTDKELEQLGRLTQLKSLRLIGTPISDFGLKHLSELQNLQELHLQGTQVTGHGVQSLKDKLPHCRISRE